MGYIDKQGNYVDTDNLPPEVTQVRKHPLQRRYEMDRELETYRKDIIQPYLPNGQPNPEFIEAYPDYAAEKYHFVNPEEKNA